MSYCRFERGHSDLYVFGTCRVQDGKHVIECCGCPFDEPPDGPFPQFDNYGDLVRHINKHRDAGHLVPAYLDEQIRYEIDHSRQRWIDVGYVPDSDEMTVEPEI